MRGREGKGKEREEGNERGKGRRGKGRGERRGGRDRGEEGKEREREGKGWRGGREHPRFFTWIDPFGQNGDKPKRRQCNKKTRTATN